ncbi:MAG: hypothetical protein CSA65_00975 [Proteobacteria bacterium]|nr:MAG: hypothetical protein CSA65_00975 [Pseudomonadota bacterium]
MFSRLVLVATLVTILAAPPASADTLTTNLAINGDTHAAALSFVRRHRRQLGAPGATLAVRSETPLRGGLVVRLSQRYAGLPVLDADVAVTILGGRLIAATGRLRPISAFAGAATIHRASAAAALQRALAGARITAARQAVEVRGGKARVVWELSAISWKPYDTWRARVDARTGKLLSGLSTRRHGQAKALAYLPNPEVGKLSVVTLRLYEVTKLAGRYADVQRCGASQSKLECERLASYDRQHEYLLAAPDEPTFDDAFAEAHTYYHVDSFHRWMAKRFGFKRTSKDQQIKVFVNFHFLGGDGTRHQMANAFFGDVTGDNKGDLVFGQGQRDFAYDGDVVYHEFTHSAVDETSNLTSFFDDLGYNGFPLALNEAFADLMSCAYTGDGALGEYAGAANGKGPIRDLEGGVRTCDHLIAESHQDGVIWGRLNWTIRKKVAAAGLSVKTYDGVMYKVMVGLGQNADFKDAAKLLLAVAKAEDAEIGTIAQAEVEARGLLDCKRILELTPEKPRSGYILGTASIIGLDYVPAGLQYEVKVPANVTSMTIALAGTAGGGDNSGRFLGAFIRKGAPISFTGDEPKRDFTMDGAQNEYTLELGGEQPLEPGAVYYVLPLNVSQQQLSYEVSVFFSSPPSTPDASIPTPDAGPAADLAVDASNTNRATGGGGCALMSRAPAPMGLGLASLLLGLAMLRRLNATRRHRSAKRKEP